MLETNLSNRFLFLLSLILCYGSNVGHALAFQTTRKVVSDGSNIPVADAAAPAADENLQSRKHFLRNGMVLLSASTGLIPKVAEAAVPVTIKETDSLGAMAKRALQPKPPKVLRRKLAQDFAVLLMRSSYNALDQLDCVAMDQFQRDFFLIRSSEYETYTKSLGLGMVQQGDLTDPYYFDFISFVQYKTINREISVNPAFVFEEQQGIDQGEDRPQKFVSVIIKRDPSLTNKMLGPEHSRIVGCGILDRLEEIFGGTESAIPKVERNSKPDSGTLLKALKQLVNLFLVNGYAFGGDVSIVSENLGIVGASGTKFVISLNAPATVWGGKILQKEGATLSNNFILKAATEFINRVGYSVTSSVKYDGTKEEIVITIA